MVTICPSVHPRKPHYPALYISVSATVSDFNFHFIQPSVYFMFSGLIKTLADFLVSVTVSVLLLLLFIFIRLETFSRQFYSVTGNECNSRLGL